MLYRQLTPTSNSTKMFLLDKSLTQEFIPFVIINTIKHFWQSRDLKNLVFSEVTPLYLKKSISPQALISHFGVPVLGWSPREVWIWKIKSLVLRIARKAITNKTLVPLSFHKFLEEFTKTLKEQIFLILSLNLIWRIHAATFNSY